MSPQVIVVAGGATPPHPALRSHLPAEPALVVAADSGVSHAELLGLHVDRVVGDFDSAEPDALDRAVAAGALVERHRAEKDKTDLELALDAAVQAHGASASYVVVASGGGRLDHALANLLLLASPVYAQVAIEAYVDDWHVTVVRTHTALAATPGGLVTLLPVGGDAVGVVTGALRYPLRAETLPAGTTRGVSNVADEPVVHVGLEAGVLLALREWADSLHTHP
jgi:thiamine pyrophosphokinase